MKKIVKYLIIKHYSGGGGANAVKSGFFNRGFMLLEAKC